MNVIERDLDILEKIVEYCGEIESAGDIFGSSLDKLKTIPTYKNAVAMCILQIGELVGHLTDDFKKRYTKMPWQSIKAMRNVAAHRYGSFDLDKMWGTMTEDIPELCKYCEEIIKENTAAN